jgi:hypothetical protein
MNSQNHQSEENAPSRAIIATFILHASVTVRSQPVDRNKVSNYAACVPLMFARLCPPGVPFPVFVRHNLPNYLLAMRRRMIDEPVTPVESVPIVDWETFETIELT